MTSAEANVPNLLRTIMATSRQMLVLAQTEKWDELAEQEPLRREQIARLKDILSKTASNQRSTVQDRARVLVREILAIDAQTQELAGRRLADLGESFQSAEVSRRLNNTYLCP